MRRIKQIINALMDIGRDPTKELATAWTAVANGTTVTQEQINLLDRVMSGVLLMAEEAKGRPAKAEGEAQS